MNITLEEIREKAQGGKRSKNFLLNTGYVMHRNVSAYITLFLVRYFPQTPPNVVSGAMIGISVLGVGILLLDTPLSYACGILFLYFGFLLDKVDGELARLQNKHSVLGMYLDELYHILFPALFFLTFIHLSSAEIAPRLAVAAALGAVALRYHRKVALAIFTKRNDLIMEGVVRYTEPSQRLLRFTRIWPFRLTSIVERYDVTLLAFSLVYLWKLSTIPDVWSGFFSDFLILYTALYSLALLRAILASIGGKIDQDIKDLKERGY